MQLRSWDDERRYNKRIFGGQGRVVSNTVVCLGRSGSGWCGALWCNGATVVPRCLSIKTRDTTLRYQADSGLRHWSAHITISITIPTLNPLDFVADFLSFHFLRLLKPIEMSFGGAGKQSWKKLHRISLLHFGISNTSYLDNTKTFDTHMVKSSLTTKSCLIFARRISDYFCKCAAWITARGSDTKMTHKYFSHNLDVNCHKYFLTSCVLINQSNVNTKQWETSNA